MAQRSDNSFRVLLDEARQHLEDSPNAQCRDLAARITSALNRPARKPVPVIMPMIDPFILGIQARWPGTPSETPDQGTPPPFPFSEEIPHA